MKTYLKDTEATEQFGAKLWAELPTKCVIFLQGDLGAGKTTLVRGFLRAAGYTGAVKSPTYTLVEEYTIAGRKIFHFDLYRVADPEELEWIGIRDYFDQDCVCFIEWPDMGKGFLPEPDRVISLATDGNGRSLELHGNSQS
ncbi:tRNA threonylcarbamoyladenosine biosynthesis protein TsaE [Methylobacter tundripaludum]|uniref:tRNA threonylcarbamoyladenosine biosynthesis protein TsaE n=1 Tax=Methylobacter tundripaludum TaxID=173365 RepID=A0A2S6GSN6_9GAMM|nr:tRNA (adenosine(37)-N6)-threonylcarbamoyltransferase complex ATPase subunit type 1 TsaE [Methylobacter tundripaludum]PPK68220.1 tRNA threonylcarbamoyladenosine biosynthesis protein TsaE [Methylobacter tundripaludum]